MAPKGQKKKSTKAAASAKPKQQGNHDVANGKSSSNGQSKKLSPAPPSPSLLPAIIVAVAAFLAGVITPPSLYAIRHQEIANANAPDPETSLEAETSLLQFPLPSHHFPCTKSNLDNYLHAIPVPGLHVVCVEPLYTDADGKEVPLPPANNLIEEQRRLEQAESLQFTLFKGSHAAPLRRRIKVAGGSSGSGNNNKKGGVESIQWSDVKFQLMVELGLVPEGPQQQPWALFTATGERIIGEREDVSVISDDGIGSNKHIMSSMAASGIVVITQGGNWIWPGVREGFQRTVELEPSKLGISATSGPRNVTIETLSLKPLVVSIKGFLTDEECDYIANKAEPSMQYSGVTLKDADKGKAATEWRTSQSTFLGAGDDEILKDIEHRTASLTRVPRNHQEYVQVLRYGHNEKYDHHHDYFDPASYKSDKGTLNLIQNGKKNRYATVFWYLTDVHEGGHTIFPRAGGLPPVWSHKDCSKGLKVQPQKGKVIIFYSLDAAGHMDEYSLHGACPVGEDNVKWAANKWIWNAPMGYIRD